MRRWWVVIVALLLILPWIGGWFATSRHSDQLRAWAMIGAEGTKNRETVDNTEFVNFDTATFIMFSKTGDNMLTRQYLQRSLDFHHYVLGYKNNRLLNTDCLKRGRCLFSSNPADLFQNGAGDTSYLATSVTSEQHLLGLVNTAINPMLFSDVAIASVFGGTTPSELTFNSTSSMYNLQAA